MALDAKQEAPKMARSEHRTHGDTETASVAYNTESDAHRAMIALAGLSFPWFDGTTFTLIDIPAASVSGVFKRGMTHIDGSEASSAVLARIKRAIAAEVGNDSDGKPKLKSTDVTNEQVAAFRAAHPAEAEKESGSWLTEARSKYRDAILAGELGTREGVVTQEQKDRTRAAMRVLADLAAATGRKVAATDTRDKVLNERNREINATHVATILGKVDAGGYKHEARFAKYLAEIKAARVAVPEAETIDSDGLDVDLPDDVADAAE